MKQKYEDEREEEGEYLNKIREKTEATSTKEEGRKLLGIKDVWVEVIL